MQSQSYNAAVSHSTNSHSSLQFSILLQVCQYGAHIDGTTPHPYSCGTNNGAMLVMSSFSPLEFTITYTGGEGDR